MKRFLVVWSLCSITFISTDMALAYEPGTPYSWDSTTPNYRAEAKIHNGTIDTSVFSFVDYIGRNATTPGALCYGDSGVRSNWDDTFLNGVGDNNTNGDTLDGLWVQVFEDGGWWDLGDGYSAVAVFTSQDHGPYLGEGLEYKVYVTNSLWSQIDSYVQVSDIYLDGWRTHDGSEDTNRNGWLSDDISAIFNFGTPYRYIKLVPWGGDGYYEPEIDAVGGVLSGSIGDLLPPSFVTLVTPITPVPEPAVIPAPGALILAGIGVSVVTWLRRRRTL